MKPIIVFSGIDSAGKSTQIRLLKTEFMENHLRHKVIWSRGGYTSGFETVKKIMRFIFRKKLPNPGRNIGRQVLFDKKPVTKIWYVLAMLDLIRLYAITFRIYRLFGFTIVADRYLWDTYVDFKMSLKNVDIDKSILWKIAVFLSPTPKKAILLYVSPEVSFQRSKEKKEPYFDTLEIRTRRVETYLSLIEKKKWTLVIDTETKDIQSTYKEIEGHIHGL